MKPIHIIGGGLAGLTLGIALRRADVPVTVTEAGFYPRHRVCGEFISGAGKQALEALGLGDLLAGTVENRRTSWFDPTGKVFSASLPTPAFGISRHRLDSRLARRFQTEGGRLITGNRIAPPFPAEGTVWAAGRQGNATDWIGLKLHCRDLPQETDLAMHLGRHGYIGISRIEEGRQNVCGLFRLRRGLSPGKAGILPAYLRAAGLDRLADQLEAAEIDPDSITATTALRFVENRWPAEAICIGDSNTSIPPFAGNGMSMAFESANIALDPILGYASGDSSWESARRRIHQKLRRRFRLRTTGGRVLHPLLLNPAPQRLLCWSAAHQILPFHLFYRLLR